jgi:shikimate dehydrogenase
VAVKGLGALGFRGANVTLPHKRAVLPALDSLASHARALGAVNTIVIDRREDGTALMSGHNTDDQGFISALRLAGHEPGSPKRAIVVGAGGAARAVVHGLYRSGRGELVVLNRTPERALALVSQFAEPSGQGAKLRAMPYVPELLVEAADSADLLVNATTVGMEPHADGSIWPQGTALPENLTVFDLVYSPAETLLLQQAQEGGARPIGGLEMLVQQGALAFELWTGIPAPVDIMRAAAREALQQRS